MTDMLAGHVVVRAIGWAILLSLWQGALIGVLTALLLRSMRAVSASLRYAVACLGLAALTLSWIVAAATYAADARRASIPDGIARVELSAPDTNPVLITVDPTDVTVPAGASSGDFLEQWLPRLESWSVAVVPVWFLGICVLSTRLIAVWLLVAYLRRAATQPVPDVWLERVRQIATGLRVSRPVRLVQSAVVQVPMVVGWLRPVILLPASVFTGLTVGQLEAVIAHELAHVRRHDYAVNIAQTVVEILLFYHPATWWISRHIRMEREHCCDDVAVTFGGNRVAYAAALADLEALRSQTAGMALAATDGPLMRRVQRLVAPTSARSSWSALGASATLPLIVVTLALVSTAIAGTSGSKGDPNQSPAPAGRNIPDTEGVVEGYVLDAGSGRPVPLAMVDVLGEQRTTTVSTDDNGRYEASGLAPGEYRVQASARGYASRYYGQRARSERPVAVDVHGGRLTTNVDVRLEVVGAISGRVFDERGEGVGGVEVELVTKRYVPGGTLAVGVGFAQTEALGVFRVHDVLPGDYYVRAYVPGRMPSGPAGALPSTGDESYGVTFYPNVPGIDAAQTLHVGAGQELFDVNLTLVASRTYRVAGTVVDPTGRAVAGTGVRLNSIGVNGTRAEYAATVDADGRFEIRDVVPADYMLLLFDPVRSASPTSRWMAAYREITVDDDVVGLELRARLAARVEGRITRDAGVTRPFSPGRTHVRFERRPRQMPIGGPVYMSGDASIRADGTFSTGTAPGPSSIEVIDLPAGWTVKAIRVDGVEIGDQPVDLGEGGRRRLEIVVTDRISRISGTVVDQRGRPVSNASVVVFASDPARWIAASRYVRETGLRRRQFVIDALPPEDYLAVAVEPLPFNAWFDPNVLEQLRPTATRVRLAEGEHRALSLRLAPTPRR